MRPEEPDSVCTSMVLKQLKLMYNVDFLNVKMSVILAAQIIV